MTIECSWDHCSTVNDLLSKLKIKAPMLEHQGIVPFIAEPEGEASNLDASLTVRLYVYIYIYITIKYYTVQVTNL